MVFKETIRRGVGLLPLAILLFVFLLGNAVAAYLFAWQPIFFGNFGVFQIYACFVAQAGIYCVLSGMLGRAWITSFLNWGCVGRFCMPGVCDLLCFNRNHGDHLRFSSTAALLRVLAVSAAEKLVRLAPSSKSPRSMSNPIRCAWEISSSRPP